MVFIENEGALFQGRARAWPDKVWDDKTKSWAKYEGEVPKPIEWGTVIDEAEAKRLMGDAPKDEMAAA